MQTKIDASKTRFLFHVREITKDKALVLSARGKLQSAYRLAQDEGFDLTALKRELEDLNIGKPAAQAVRQKQETYRKWLTEF